ncbi:hypothetical protein MIR68_007587 [Amoeboaphelidium protococcarum]|nr:hypothetical protein MIR68_007587 [Amoeboaphelidium protococcarum]
MTTESAADLKAQGNKCFTAGNYDQAAEFFSKAIELSPNDQILYSNRSGCYTAMKDYDLALKDAEQSIKLMPSWGKAYGRKGAALIGLGKFEEAADAYSEGLKYDPSNANLKKGVEDAQQRLSQQGSAGGNPFAGMFGPDFIAKIASDPRTAPYLAQPDFMQMLNNVKNNPNSIASYLQDPRMMAVMSVLLGVNIQTAASPEEASQMAGQQATSADNEDEVDAVPDLETRPADSQDLPSDSNAKDQKPQEPSDVPQQEVNPEEEKALQLKTEAGDLYRKKQFQEAIAKYEQALELTPTDITLLNNIGASCLELAQYEKCIEVCQKAVDVGRENRADFKHIARALSRIGAAYMKQQQFGEAIKFFEKSLSEHRNPDVLNKLKQCEKLKEEDEVSKYQDPVKSEEARNRGNELFKGGKYADAVKEYSEAIKRSLKDAKGYSNRAAAYIKLMALPEGLQDCEQAIALDKTFVKAYIRKAAILFMMKEYQKCVSVCDEAIEIDEAHNEGKSRYELEQQKQKATNAMYGYGADSESANMSQEERAKKAMQDPKVQQILADPVMRQILDQMAQDPNAARDHLQNPVIRDNIQYLAQAGIIGLR